MKIRIVKKGTRNQLVCIRDNDSTEIADLGPTLPFHDIAHYVVERHLELREGFYGNIAKGYTVAQLSDKNVIRTLPTESLIAEIITRALQSVYSGAVTIEQFPELVHAEFEVWSIERKAPDIRTVEVMMTQYREFLQKWEMIPQGEHLELTFW